MKCKFSIGLFVDGMASPCIMQIAEDVPWLIRLCKLEKTFKVHVMVLGETFYIHSICMWGTAGYLNISTIVTIQCMVVLRHQTPEGSLYFRCVFLSYNRVFFFKKSHEIVNTEFILKKSIPSCSR